MALKDRALFDTINEQAVSRVDVYDELGNALGSVNRRQTIIPTPGYRTMSAEERAAYGGSAADQKYFSDTELQKAAEYRAAVANGAMTEQQAHGLVENMRGQYDYYGGEDGSGYKNGRGYIGYSFAGYDADGNRVYSKDKPNAWEGGSPGGSDDADSGTGTKSYGSGIGVGGFSYPEFSYSTETDPLYQAYAKQYTRNGQRAMQDTMGQVAARTGGLASSYGATAAQQSYNNYMAGLNDRVVDLYNLAYDRYSDGYDRAYGQYRDSVADSRYADETAYARQQYADELAYNRQLTADEEAYNRQLAKAELLAAMGDYSGYDALYGTNLSAQAQALYDAAAPAYSVPDTGTYSGYDNGRYTAAADTPVTQKSPTTDSAKYYEAMSVADEMRNMGYTNDDIAYALGEMYSSGELSRKEYDKLSGRYVG